MNWRLGSVIDPRYGRRSREGVLHRQGRLRRRPRPRGRRRASVRPADAAGVGLLDRARAGIGVGTGSAQVQLRNDGRGRRRPNSSGAGSTSAGCRTSRLGLVRLLRRPGRRTAGRSRRLPARDQPTTSAGRRGPPGSHRDFDAPRCARSCACSTPTGLPLADVAGSTCCASTYQCSTVLPFLSRRKLSTTLLSNLPKPARAVGRSAGAGRRGRAVRMPKRSSTSLGRVGQRLLG